MLRKLRVSLDLSTIRSMKVRLLSIIFKFKLKRIKGKLEPMLLK